MFNGLKNLVTPVLLGLLLATSDSAPAQGGPPGFDRPAKVVTERARLGILAPQTEFRGTVYFKEVAEVAAEVQGKVIDVMFEEGQRVERGAPLVRLDDTLLQKELKAMKATRDRHRADLDDAKVRFKRAENLVEQGISTGEQYDEYRFDVKSLGYQLASTEADLERIEALIEKNTIYAPFDGVVIDRMTDLGEWKGSGDSVAVIARENLYEVMVDVPESSVGYVQPGASAPVSIGQDSFEGEILTIIPRGDIATRTIPVKIGIQSERRLYEGMSALVRLPVGVEQECAFITRDALLRQINRQVVLFTVRDNIAQQRRVDVLGYDGLYAGISLLDLEPGEEVIVKGHELIKHGASIEIVPNDTASVPPVDSDD